MMGEGLELCLEPLTVLDLPATQAPGLAAAGGYGFVSLWTQSPPGYAAPCLVEKGPMAREVAQRLSDGGIGVRNLEVFDLTADTDVSIYRPALELGAALGAVAATAMLRQNPDPQRRLDQFVALCQLGAEYGLRVNAEFISYSSLASLHDAVGLLAAARQPNAGIVVDLLHLFRSGGSPDEVRDLDPVLIGHPQVCDGPATITDEARRLEGSTGRLVPGEGDFPVRAFLAALPRLPIGVEVPPGSPSVQGMTPIERVVRLAQATRRLAGED